MSSSSSLSSSSSTCESIFQYDIFVTVRTYNPRAKTYLETSSRNAGITTYIDDRSDLFPVHEAIEKSRIIMVIFTPEFLQNSYWIVFKRLMSIMWYHQSMKKPMLPLFWGVSQQEVREKLEDASKLDIWQLNGILFKSAIWKAGNDGDTERAIGNAAPEPDSNVDLIRRAYDGVASEMRFIVDSSHGRREGVNDTTGIAKVDSQVDLRRAVAKAASLSSFPLSPDLG